MRHNIGDMFFALLFLLGASVHHFYQEIGNSFGILK